MKPILLLTTFLSLSLTSFAQDPPWFEVGSEWTYQHGHCCGPEHFQVKFGITEQTTHLGKACTKMDHISGWGYGCMALQPPFYFYVSNDSLFISNNDLDEFRLAVYFGAEPGDSWEFTTGAGEFTESFSVEVNTVTTIDIDGHTLRQLNVTFEYLDDPFYYFIDTPTMDITEVLGAQFVFFVPVGHHGLCKGATNIILQCFESPSISYLSPTYPSCDFIVGIEENDLAETLNVFPNPASNWLQLESNSSEPIRSVDIYNLSGQLMSTYPARQINNETIDVSALPPGMYLIHAHSASGLHLAKVMKE